MLCGRPNAQSRLGRICKLLMAGLVKARSNAGLIMSPMPVFVDYLYLLLYPHRLDTAVYDSKLSLGHPMSHHI
jgi:hypothetical protein